ncbi:tetratricopeptide repeat protein, partial [Cupriavidus pauculus]
MRVWLPVSLALLICACSNKEGALPSPPDPGAVRTNLAFTCARETDHLPPLDPQTDSLFLYARHLQKQPGPKDFNEMARYYRIAAAHGHYKANHNLQLLVSQGFADSPAPSRETIDLAAQLISLGVPGGYFDMGHYLELGYGVKQDSELALRYFRKAADLGNPEAQSYIAKLLAPFDKAPEIALKMRQCATDQGYGDAANTLGINRQDKKNFVEAILAFQQGVKAGNSLSALALEEGF